MKYAKLFELQNLLYTEKSPLIISAGVLSKNVQTGKLIVQLKMESISDKVIKAIKVNLRCFDTAGRKIEPAVTFEYLDLYLKRGMKGCSKTPIHIENRQVRYFKAEVSEVVFEDRSVWYAPENADWECLPQQGTHFANQIHEIREQFLISINPMAKYELLQTKDIWICPCGAVNHENEITCFRCKVSREAQENVDFEKLKRDANIREQKERMIFEQKERAKLKNRKKILIMLISICACVTVLAILLNSIIPNSVINEAMALVESGNYSEADQLIENSDLSFNRYNDYINQKNDYIKQKLEILKQQCAYNEAISTLEDLGYSDYSDEIKEIKDLRIINIKKNGNMKQLITQICVDNNIANWIEDCDTDQILNIFEPYEDLIDNYKVKSVKHFNALGDVYFKYIALGSKKDDEGLTYNFGLYYRGSSADSGFYIERGDSMIKIDENVDGVNFEKIEGDLFYFEIYYDKVYKALKK